MKFLYISSFILLIHTINCVPLKKNIGRRIINGNEIEIDQAPYHVGLTDNFYDYAFCGGTLLSERYVLTAANCLYLTNTDELSVYVGSNTIDKASKITVKSAISHPQYDYFTDDYDFAILELESADNFPEIVEFAKLPSQADTLEDDENLFVTGWGWTDFFPEGDQKVLRGVNVSNINHEDCQRRYDEWGYRVTDRMMCAVGYDKGYCNGKYWFLSSYFQNLSKNNFIDDNGGGLVRQSDGIVFGVASYPYFCGFWYYPDIYGKVSSVLDWIYDNTDLQR